MQTSKKKKKSSDTDEWIATGTKVFVGVVIIGFILTGLYVARSYYVTHQFVRVMKHTPAQKSHDTPAIDQSDQVTRSEAWLAAVNQDTMGGDEICVEMSKVVECKNCGDYVCKGKGKGYAFSKCQVFHNKNVCTGNRTTNDYNEWDEDNSLETCVSCRNVKKYSCSKCKRVVCWNCRSKHTKCGRNAKFTEKIDDL